MRDFIYHKWGKFAKEALLFSDSFRQVMSSQLYKKFYAKLGITDEIKQDKFFLIVGEHALKLKYKGEYAFGLVYIFTPIALNIPVTAYWRPINNIAPDKAPDLDIWNNENIEFGWCNDFDINDFTTYLKPRKIYPKEQVNTFFDIEYDYTLYPDLCLTICFNEKVYKDELKEIESVLSATIKDAYVSELTNEEDLKESDNSNEITGIIDFEDTDFDKGLEQLIEAFKKISQRNVGKKIERIVIE